MSATGIQRHWPRGVVAARALLVLELRDQIRDRKALLARLVPVLTVILGGAVALLGALSGDEEDEDRRDIGFEDVAAIDDIVLTTLEDRAFTITPATLPDAVADGTVPVGLAATDDGYVVLARDEAGSAAVARRVEAALAEADLRLNPTPTRYPLRVESVEPSVRAARRLLAAVLPGALAILLATALANAAAQWTEADRRGTLAFQLSLPIPRDQMLAARTLAEVVLTLVAVSPVLALLALGVFLIVVNGGSAAGAVVAIGLLALAAAAVAALYGAAGLIIAVRRPRSQKSGLLVVPMLAGTALLLLYTVRDEPLPDGVAAIPVFGLLDALHRAVEQRLAMGTLVLAVVSTVLGIGLLLRRGLAGDLDDFGMRQP